MNEFSPLSTFDLLGSDEAHWDAFGLFQDTNRGLLATPLNELIKRMIKKNFNAF